jgi:phospholipid/cholesterol/gamma-HCH transport system ATP-binding protein
MSHSQNNHVAITNLHFMRDERVVFDSVNIEIERGKITAIMGPSGCGKTTLLRLIGAQIYPDAGKVLVDDVDIHALSVKDLYIARRSMGLLFQSGALFTNLSVFENVAFTLREHTQLDEQMIHDLVLMQLEAVGLRGARDLMPNQLSGGMAHRVALARALVMDPKLMMYDEPFTGQDPINMGVLIKLIKKLNDTLEMTSIIVSHDVNETLSIADYVYVLAGCKVVGEGSPQQILADQNPWVKQFIHGLPDGVIPFHFPALDYKKDLNLC